LDLIFFTPGCDTGYTKIHFVSRIRYLFCASLRRHQVGFSMRLHNSSFGY